ncbi:tripartite tricarboxylate transporter substrate binding protein [Diaphorobacter sp.]|uniref:Bug family tripartite tricarboxylate transporter substrate binding protein n=1 Tax=Diaphorobacter sp. TaxID=1934310 RepID=UPI0028AFB091|nr:tripartite tricarboxylate transporter substrate binding protein [Diaphorobacter sp.]
MSYLNKRQFLTFSAALMTAMALSAPAQATDIAEGPITLVIPFSAGGSTDVVGRLIADKLAVSLGRSVVVDNKPGAGGNIAAVQVARSKPDGRTLLLGTTGIMAINEYLYSKPGYQIHENFEPVIYATSISNVLVVNNSFPANDLKEFLDVVKKNPGKYTFASSGAGSSTHLTGELFKYMSGTTINHVPYRGSSQALVDLVGGQIDMIFDNAPSSIPLINTKKIKVLGVTAAQRIDALPQVPTISEVLLPGYESLSWTAVLAPKGTPAEIVQKFNQTINAILSSAETKAKLKELGALSVGGSPQDLKTAIDSERKKWSTVIQQSKIEKI